MKNEVCMFKKISGWFKEMIAPVEEVHHCLMCGEEFKGSSAFDLSEDCTYSHEHDTEEERARYPNRLAILKKKAHEEKQVIINEAGLKNNKRNIDITKKRL